MSKANHKDIPVYRIDRFSKRTGEQLYDVDVFDSSRTFDVAYPHRHEDFYEVLFISEGKGSHTIDFRNHPILPNTVFFLSPGQIHELNLSEDVKGYIFLFSSEFYHLNKTDPNKLFELPFFYSIGNDTPPLQLHREEDISTISNLFKLAITETENSMLEKEEAVRAILDLILIQCKRLYPNPSEHVHKKGKILVKRFKQLIELHCIENLSVKDYAQLLHISPSHLSEVVKEITGRTSTDLINDRMSIEIKRLLIHTELSISEIAYQLNFADQSYFSKYFRKISGISPNEFRAQGINQ